MKLIIFCLIFLKASTAHPKFAQICNSDECHLQSKSLLSKIDTSVSPCDDFYQFSCGNYRDVGSTMHEYQNNIDSWIKKVATEPFHENDDKMIKLIKIFYQSCLNDRGSINDVIEDEVNMRRRASSSEYDTWEDIIQDLQLFQNTDAYLFSTKIGYVDDHVLLVVDQPQFETKAGFLERESEEAEEFYSGLIDFMIELKIDRSEAEEIQTKAFVFENQLFEFIDETSEAQIEIVTIAELQEVFTFINWTHYMKNFFDGSEKIDENFVLGVKNQEVLMKIDDFLFSSLGEDIFNYLLWRFIESAYIATYYENDDENSIEKLSFDDSDPNFDRRQPCTSCICKLKHELDVAVAAVYVKHNVDQNDHKEITEMIKSMKSQLFDTLKSLDWLDNKTKAAAVKKLSAMKYFVGYPDILLNEEFLSEYYQGLDITKRSLVQIIDQIARNKKENQRKFLTDPKSVDDVTKEVIFLLNFVKHIITPNALYAPELNYFMICAGLINSNTFSINRPQALNFGFTGNTIGHEIFHGFDNTGRLYNEDGKLENWWEKGAEKEFEKKSKCFVDQYGSYVEPITGLRINGVKTLSENIADNGGLMLAYNTFQKLKQFDPILPNANFTSNQLLWLSMAQFYCSNYSYAQMKYLVEHDVHTPYRLRVFGTLGNLKEFSEDFQCPKGSKMNRKDKCNIW